MLEKNKEKLKRKEARHKIMGRPVRFKKKTTYDRKKRKQEDEKEKSENIWKKYWQRLPDVI